MYEIKTHKNALTTVELIQSIEEMCMFRFGKSEGWLHLITGVIAYYIVTGHREHNNVKTRIFATSKQLSLKMDKHGPCTKGWKLEPA